MLKVDDRDVLHSPSIIEHLRLTLGSENVKVERLPFGDYAFEGALEIPALGRRPTVGIELMTVPDLCHKITTNRLNFQVNGLIDTYDIRILMVIGSIMDDGTGHVKMWGSNIPSRLRVDSVRNLLFSAKMHGINSVEEVSNKTEAAQRIESIYRWFQKTEHSYFRRVEGGVERERLTKSADSSDMLLTVPVGRPIERPIRVICAAADGIGEEAASALLRQYGTLMVAFTLNEDDLRKVPGWGPTLSKRFVETARRMITND